MSIVIECPNCGENDRSNMKPDRQGERIFIDCRTCGTRWERHSDQCPECGERKLVPQRLPLYQKARGTQQSIIGYRTGRVCNGCGWASEPPPDTNAAE